MTPDAVIYKYIELLSRAEIDTDLLTRLIASDADLFFGWMRLFHIPASQDRLARVIGGLGPRELDGLARAHIDAYAHVDGSARLSLEQWQSVAKAAFAAQSLYVHCAPDTSASDARDVRLRALLALSGVQHDSDPRLIELIDYRGINPILMEDATLEMRVFAVVEGLELGREASLAEMLLHLREDELDQALKRGSEMFVAEMAALDIGGDGEDAQWGHRIWLYRQVRALLAVVRTYDLPDQLLEAHNQAAPLLFRRLPLVMWADSEALSLRLLGDEGLSMKLDSHTSRVAYAARTGSAQTIGSASDQAVVDRQLLRRLGAEECVAVAAEHRDGTLVMLVDADEDFDAEAAAVLYVAELKRCLDDRDESPAATSLDSFRESEQERLREIVHEANNPLSIVHNYLHILELRFKSDEQAVEQLRIINAELKRAGEIFARVREIPAATDSAAPLVSGERSELMLLNWLSDLVQLMQGSARNKGVSLELVATIDADTTLTVDAGALQQILTNLLKNAVEACAVGDAITVEVTSDIYRGAVLGLEIAVADTGPGLPREVLASLAAVKISQKGGEHQGIGLQVAFRLAMEIGAALDVRANLPGGTRFQLFVPTQI